MVDEFELFKARSYTGGADATAILVTSSSHRILSGPEVGADDDDDEVCRVTEVERTASFRPRRLEWPAPSVENCLSTGPLEGSSYRRHSAVGLPVADCDALQSHAGASQSRRHKDHRTSLTTGKPNRKAHSSGSSACGSGHLQINAATEIWNINRPRSSSWQGDQLHSDVDDPTERRVSSASSAATIEDSSPTGGEGSCGSGSRKNSEFGNGSQKQSRRSHRITRGSPQRRTSSPTNVVIATSPTVSISEPQTTEVSTMETTETAIHLHQTGGLVCYPQQFQRRSSNAGLLLPVAYHGDDVGQSVVRNVAGASSGSPDSRQQHSSPSTRRNSSPPPPAARHSTAGGRRNSAITYITDVSTPSSSSHVMQSLSGKVHHHLGQPHQQQRPDRLRRCSLQAGMLHATPLTGNEPLGSQFVLEKSTETQDDTDDVEDSSCDVAATDILLAVNGRRCVDGLCTDLLAEDRCCSPPGSTGGSGRSLVVSGEFVAEITTCRVAVYGGQQVGKTTLIDQLLTSEYLANRGDDSNGYHGNHGRMVSNGYHGNHDDDNLSKSAIILLDEVECLVEFVECGRIDNDDEKLFDISFVVYSVTDKRSFDYARVILDQLLQSSSSSSSNGSGGHCLNQHGVVALVANKNDLVRNRAVSTADGKKLLSQQKSPHGSGAVFQFMEVSALLDHRVDEVLTEGLRAHRRQRAAALKRRRSSPRPSSHASNHRQSNSSSSGAGAGLPGLNGTEDGLDNRSMTSDSDNKCCIQRAAYAVLSHFIKKV